MNRTAPLILALLLTAALPAQAQDAPAEGSPDEGFSLIEEGAKMILEGMFEEMGPAVRGMSEALETLQPKVQELLELIDDVANYESPVLLENGDILIRRRAGAPLPGAPSPVPAPAAPTDPGAQIEL